MELTWKGKDGATRVGVKDEPKKETKGTAKPKAENEKPKE